MKPAKVISKFYYTHKGRALFAALKPVKLLDNSDLIDRVYQRYPYLNRGHLALIIQTTLTILRELLLKGRTISLRPLLPNFKLYIFQHIENGITYPAAKVKIGTPENWKERPSWIKRTQNQSL